MLLCGLTAYAHPLTCAAIVAAIGAYRAQGLVARTARLEGWLRPRIERLARQRPYVRQVRGLGLLWAIELGDAAGGFEPASSVRMKALAASLRKRRLHLHKRDNMLFVAPPLVVEKTELETGLAAIGDALDEVWAS